MKPRIAVVLVTFCTLAVLPGRLLAGAAHVKHVRLLRLVKGWEMAVTIEHHDVDWRHYVDRWEVLDGQGKRLGIRRLTGPHLNKRGVFTEKMELLTIPAGVRKIVVRAHDLVHGYSGRAVTLDFTEPMGKDYEILKKAWNNRYQYFKDEGRFFRSWRYRYLGRTTF